MRLILCLAAVGVAFAGVRRPGDTRPNLVLFFPDTISAEANGPAYGSPIVKTPAFDAFLASGAALFDTAYSSYPQCSPSRTTLVTGRHVHTLGHRTMTHLVQPTESNLWSMLKASGYDTLHFGKNDMLAQASFGSSFMYWRDGQGVSQGDCPYAFGEEGYYSFMAGPGAAKGSEPAGNADLKAVYSALALINTTGIREPFALFLPGIGAHPPYGMPKDYADMYSPAEIERLAPLRPMNDTVGKPPYYGQGGIRKYRNITDFGDAFSYKVAANYFARVTYTDYIFGELLAGIDALGLTPSTVVATSSDHGDFFGNYGLVEKWSGSGDDLLLHVPLAVRIPGGPTGVRVSQPVQIFDLLPTFLELAGAGSFLSSPSNVTGYVQFGKSLVPWLQGGTPSDVHDFVYAEAGYHWLNEIEYNDPTQNATWQDPHMEYWPRGQEEHVDPTHAVRLVAMRNSTLKMVYRARGTGSVSELYDLEADPRQMRNVWGVPAYAAAQAELLAAMLDWFVLTGDVTDSVYDPRGLPPSPPVPTAAGRG